MSEAPKRRGRPAKPKDDTGIMNRMADDTDPMPESDPMMGHKTLEIVEWNRAHLTREAFDAKYQGWASYDDA